VNSHATFDLAVLDDEASAPRDNGELVFDAPWQARAVALAVALVEHGNLPWDAFRQRLVEAIAQEPGRPYYESWTAALESFVVSLGMTTAAALDGAGPTEPELSGPS
jgi:nitrile hydratase accessory protein